MGDVVQVEKTPPQNRAIFMNEVIHEVFRYNPRQEYLAYALVCHDWLDPALNSIWKEVRDPAILLSLLLPLASGQQSGGSNEPSSITDLPGGVLQHSWDRFLYYSRRIWRLELRKEYFSFRDRFHVNALREENFDALYKLLLGGDIDDVFPRLRSLVYHAHKGSPGDSGEHIPSLQAQHISLFLTSQLEELTFICDGRTGLEPAQLCDVIGGKQNLKKLEFLVDCPDMRQASCIQPMIKDLKNLTHLKIKSCLFTPDLFRTVATLPRLVGFYLDIHTYGSYEPGRTLCEDHRPIDAQGLSQSLSPLNLREQPLVFPHLKTLLLQGPLGPMVDLFLSTESVRQLTVLHVDVLYHTNPTEDIAALIASLPDACPDLEVFLLTRREQPERFALDDVNPMTIRTLEPLALLPQLLALEIAHSRHVKTNNDEVIHWVDRCKKLRWLTLTPEPNVPYTPVLTLDVFDGIMRIRPDMQSLVLCVDTSDINQRPFHNNWKSLYRIGFGNSLIAEDDIPYMARYLESALPTRCELITHAWDRNRFVWNFIKSVNDFR